MPTQDPEARLRAKFVVAGIPESEHAVVDLLARMPDLDPKLLADLSADGVARMLLYFTAKGLVTPAIASERALLDLPWGSHVCRFYQSNEGQLRLLVPYFQ